ncbi:MAG: hypothetical protein PHP32_02145 [Candidatus Izemoplasmatales bacterium]|nr:hypothetical protein [Candidatus Izemoplasmatales bacterium]
MTKQEQFNQTITTRKLNQWILIMIGISLSLGVASIFLNFYKIKYGITAISIALMLLFGAMALNTWLAKYMYRVQFDVESYRAIMARPIRWTKYMLILSIFAFTMNFRVDLGQIVSYFFNQFSNGPYGQVASPVFLVVFLVFLYAFICIPFALILYFAFYKIRVRVLREHRRVVGSSTHWNRKAIQWDRNDEDKIKAFVIDHFRQSDDEMTEDEIEAMQTDLLEYYREHMEEGSSPNVVLSNTLKLIGVKFEFEEMNLQFSSLRDAFLRGVLLPTSILSVLAIFESIETLGIILMALHVMILVVLFWTTPHDISLTSESFSLSAISKKCALWWGIFLMYLTVKFPFFMNTFILVLSPTLYQTLSTFGITIVWIPIYLGLILFYRWWFLRMIHQISDNVRTMDLSSDSRKVTLIRFWETPTVILVLGLLTLYGIGMYAVGVPKDGPIVTLHLFGIFDTLYMSGTIPSIIAWVALAGLLLVVILALLIKGFRPVGIAMLSIWTVLSIIAIELAAKLDGYGDLGVVNLRIFYPTLTILLILIGHVWIGIRLRKNKA